MHEIHVNESALCCTSGVCGPELDQDLVALVSVTRASCCAPSSTAGSTGGCC